jgi:UDP-N-acetylglucosamine pyrophosphorylase
VGAALSLTELVTESLSIAVSGLDLYETEILGDAPPELVRFVETVGPLERRSLAAQLRRLDFSPQKVVDGGSIGLEPAPDPTDYGDMAEDILLNGGQALRAGEIAVLLLAGDGTDALRKLDIPTKSTPLEIQLRRIKKLLSVSGAQKITGSTRLAIPVYILTSEATHSAIAAYLLRKNNFGLRPVTLVKQRTVPARTPEGRFVLADKAKVLATPGGNIFQELRDSGVLDDMKQRGVKYVDVHSVDNILAKPADPFFVGVLSYEEAEAAVKVVTKVPGENIGVACVRDGKTIVIDSSEVPPGEEEAFTLGNTGTLLYAIEVIERAASATIPYHIVKLEEVVIGEDGEKAIAEVQRFKSFAFDALSFCENVALIESKREEEFAPADSPEKAKDMLLALHRKWAEDAGIILEGEGAFELLPETTYDGDGLEMYMGFSFTLPTSI